MKPTSDYGTPGDASATTQTLSASGVAIDSAGTNTVGVAVGDEAELKEVRVNSDAQDFDFNVEMDGNDTFGSEQSPSSGSESFVPDQNRRVAGTGDATVNFAVSGASGSGGATATVVAVVETR